MSEEKKLIQVAPALAQLRALIAEVDQRVVAFATQAQEAEASLDAKSKELVDNARSELEEIAKAAASHAERAARERIEETANDLLRRLSEMEARVIAVTEALSVDADGNGIPDVFEQIKPAAGVTPSLASITGAAPAASTPRLAEVIERQEKQQREIAENRKALLGVENLVRALIAAEGLSFEQLKVEARSYGATAAE